MNKVICFDMDGTIADLYAVHGWVDKINGGDVSPYQEAKAMWDMEELRQLLYNLSDHGWEIRILTWNARSGSESFHRAVRKAKLEWLLDQEFPFDHFDCIPYGMPKHMALMEAMCRAGKSYQTRILVDDNRKVREEWNLGEQWQTINPLEGGLFEKLENLLK